MGCEMCPTQKQQQAATTAAKVWKPRPQRDESPRSQAVPERREEFFQGTAGVSVERWVGVMQFLRPLLLPLPLHPHPAPSHLSTN